METAEATLAADFTVNVYNLDSLGRLAVRSLADFLFEAASRHARRLGVDVPDLEPLGLTWMLSRLRFAVERLPGWGEAVRVTTWPSAADGLYAYRDFELRDGQGRTVGGGISAWMVIERETRRPIRIPPQIRTLPFPARPGGLSGLAVTTEAGAAEAVGAARGFTRLPKAEPPAREADFTVRAADVDANRHAGAAAYLSWILESLPPEVLPEGRLEELEIQYRAECLRGEAVRVLTREEGPGGTASGPAGEPAAAGGPSSPPRRFLHRLLRPADGRELALARSTWR